MGWAQRSLYFLPRNEAPDRSQYWLLLSVVYGFGLCKANRQEQDDTLMQQLYLYQIAANSKLFYVIWDDELTRFAAKVGDHKVAAGPNNLANNSFLQIYWNV